jgi:hypothetical protein
LSGTQFSTLNSAGINDPEGPAKYNNTEVKYGATFNSCHTSLDTCKLYLYAYFVPVNKYVDVLCGGVALNKSL